MKPLAERMRPTSLETYIGQKHLIEEGKVLRQSISNGRIPSFILWGPPGVGKTTLANIIANQIEVPFYMLSAINSGVKDIREIITKAQKNAFFDRASPILFIDEIHRFSKSQQDALLSAVEKGIITLIGATTENPSFEVIPALLSRCQVYVLQPLVKDDLIMMVQKALSEDDILSEKEVIIKEYDAMLRLSGGDGRKLYNLLELLCADNEEKIVIDNAYVMQKAQQNMRRYDKTGEQHYDIISAFIKSMRGSDPDATVYWLARMLVGGEDIKVISRRMIIFASEDIGIANPNALLISNTCFQSVSVVGMPEARIILSQTAIYLAKSKKSNDSYRAINEAMALVDKTGDLPVPLHLRNAPTKLMQSLDYGKEYLYPHDYEGNTVEQKYLPKEIENIKLYKPKKK